MLSALLVLLAVPFVAVSSADYQTTAAGGVKVYISRISGDDSNTGATAADPVQTMLKAFQVIKEQSDANGGEVLIIDGVYDSSSPKFPAIGGAVRITSADPNNQGVVVFGGSYYFRSEVIFDNVAFARAPNTTLRNIFLHYNDFTITDSCRTCYIASTSETSPDFTITGEFVPTTGNDYKYAVVIIAGGYTLEKDSDWLACAKNIAVNQKITVKGGVIAGLRLGTKPQGFANRHYYSDKDWGNEGTHISASIGGNANILAIDADSLSSVSLELPMEWIGDVVMHENVLMGTEYVPPLGKVNIFASEAQRSSLNAWITTDKIGDLGFSLRDNTGSTGAYAIRGEFRGSKAALDNAVELGVLIRNSGNTANALELNDTYINRYGQAFTADPSDFNIVNGVGKSIVYMADSNGGADLYNGLVVDTDTVTLRGVLSYDSSDYGNKNTTYDFRAYASFAVPYQPKEGTETEIIFTAYSDTCSNSLMGVAGIISGDSGASAADKAVADKCLSELS